MLDASGSHRERLARLSAKIGEIRVRGCPTSFDLFRFILKLKKILNLIQLNRSFDYLKIVLLITKNHFQSVWEALETALVLFKNDGNLVDILDRHSPKEC